VLRIKENHQKFGGREVRKIINTNDPVAFGKNLLYSHSFPTRNCRDKNNGTNVPTFYVGFSAINRTACLWDFLSPESTSLQIQKNYSTLPLQTQGEPINIKKVPIFFLQLCVSCPTIVWP